MERAKAVDRARKCLALSASSNRHEAESARRQLQKLIRGYSITDDELGRGARRARGFFDLYFDFMEALVRASFIATFGR